MAARGRAVNRRGELGAVSRQVLQLLAQGASLDEIASTLCMAEASVKYHTRQLARYFAITPERQGGGHLRLIVWAGIKARLVELP